MVESNKRTRDYPNIVSPEPSSPSGGGGRRKNKRQQVREEGSVSSSHHKNLRTVFLGMGKESKQVDSQEMIDFINEKMRKEGFLTTTTTSSSSSTAIVDYSIISNNFWRLIATSNDIAKKICYLNNSYYDDDDDDDDGRRYEHKMNIKCHRDFPTKPQFSNWNEYYMARYGRNDPFYEKHVHMVVSTLSLDIQDAHGHGLLNFLHQKLVNFGLNLTEDGVNGTFVSFHRYTHNKKKNFLIEVKSSRQAELLCYLNNITYKRKNETATIHLSRMMDWIGPKPLYKNYWDFFNTIYVYDYPGFESIKEAFVCIIDTVFPSSIANEKSSSNTTYPEIDVNTGYYRIKSPLIEDLFKDWKASNCTIDDRLYNLKFGRNPYGKYGKGDYALTNIIIEGPSFDPKDYKEKVPSFFNTMMKMHNLSDNNNNNNADEIISSVWIYDKNGEAGEKGKEDDEEEGKNNGRNHHVLMVRMFTPELADKIMLLDGMVSDDGTHTIRLKRHPEYQEPKKKPSQSAGVLVDHGHVSKNETPLTSPVVNEEDHHHHQNRQEAIEQSTSIDSQLVVIVEENEVTTEMDNSSSAGAGVPDLSTLKFCTTCMSVVHRSQWDIQTWPLLYGQCSKCKNIEVTK